MLGGHQQLTEVYVLQRNMPLNAVDALLDCDIEISMATDRRRKLERCCCGRGVQASVVVGLLPTKDAAEHALHMTDHADM